MPENHQLPPPLFHPMIHRWFQERVGIPTPVQQEGWSRIAAGENVLITAPTGSGKTLTAFLWSLNQLVVQAWPAGATRVLYISPLKALNNDIHRNLLAPLAELKEIFNTVGQFFPEINVQTRSGDTPQSHRRRMLRHPPEILITTPESLNLLLSSTGGRSLLESITTVILDEIHAVISNKRGVHLISAVDRLVRLSGDFQRIALSATVRPLDTVAEFVGGYRLSGSGDGPRYEPRPVTVIRSEASKQYQVKVRFPKTSAGPVTGESFWKPLALEFKKMIGSNRATLLFTNSRRLCEKLTLKINKGEHETIAYAHHGSLSRQIREKVEAKLKSGELKAIVATSSLELGIDIGDLDEVVLIQSPPSVSAAVQRVGRAGHRLGETSRGTLFPTHSQDCLEAAVLAAAIPAADIESVAPVRCPLDVLAQIVVSMVGVEIWDRDELYAWIKTSFPYRRLSRPHFDLVLNMLAGRYAQTRIRELKPRISIDGLDNTVAGRKGALLALYTGGGVIPDRGYYHLRHMETNARIGELDEEYVWEATVGQVFTLGTQNWKIAKITHNDVMVVPAGTGALAAPFWKGERRRRDFHFSNRLSQFLETANDQLDSPPWLERLKTDHFMDASAARELTEFLRRQKKHTGCDLPHRRHLVVEFISAGPGSVPGHQVVLHTLWGGRLNHPYALALAAAWEEKFEHRIEVYADNDGISLMLPHEEEPETLLSLVTSDRLPQLLRNQLENSGIFGARFRECAGRALLLTRRKMNERMPLWMNRLRSQKLLDAVSGFQDFPILLEAWRTCMQDEFDLPHLHQVLAELATGHIAWSAVRTARPSPMARAMAWQQTNQYMYRGDAPAEAKSGRVNADLLKDVIFSPDLRPTVPRQIAAAFEAKRKRLAKGYAPSTSRDLLDWIKERLLIPQSEWRQLLAAIHRDHGIPADRILEPLSGKLLIIEPKTARSPLICALETLPGIKPAFYGQSTPLVTRWVLPEAQADPAKVLEESIMDDDAVDAAASFVRQLAQWMQFQGPVSESDIRSTLGVDTAGLTIALETLTAGRQLISGKLLTDGDPHDLCDVENFEILMRLTRSDAAPKVEPLPLDHLQLFLAGYQGIAQPGPGSEALYTALDKLLCHPLKAGVWEKEVLPARSSSYRMEWLDRIIAETELLWIGSGKQAVSFCFESDLDLIQEEKKPTQPENARPATAEKGDTRPYADLFSDPAGRYHFSTLQQQTGRDASNLSDLLWKGTWHGCVANDSIPALRNGIRSNFKPPRKAAGYLPARNRRSRPGFHSRTAGAFKQWQQAHNVPGNWFFLQKPASTDDPLEREERNKARVRLLLDRYGILFRELLLRESLPFRWAALFRSLRIMELSGEILTGYFFKGIPGLQFISPRALRFLQGRLPLDAVYWLNAADPAALNGIQLDENRGTLPRRLASTHLVYQGIRLVMVSRRRGKALTFHVPPEEKEITRFLGPLHHMLQRPFDPLRSIDIETINDHPAATSPYLDALRIVFDVVPDYKRVTLYRSREDHTASKI